MKNEKLKEIIKHQKDIINNLEDKLLFQKLENYKLENKINRAIEYIKYCQTSDKDIFPVIEAEKMIEILKGSDK